METIPEEARTAPPPPPQGDGAAGLTAAVLGPMFAGALGAGQGAGAVLDVSGATAGQAVQLSAAAVLQAFERFLDVRALTTEADVGVLLEDEYGDVDEDVRLEAVGEELDRDRAFRGKVRARLDRDLPVIMSIPDSATRELELRKVLERERRYAAQREAAIALRSLGNVEARVVEAASPEGGYWRLSPHVREHTPDCLAMGGKVWPWTVLRQIHPPLHGGCPCELWTLQAAQGEGLLDAGDVMPNPDQAFAAFAVAEARWEINWDPAEVDESLSVLEAAWDKHYGKGTTKGGQFRPKRGGNAGRPTGARLHGPRRRRLDLLELPREKGGRVKRQAPPRVSRKRGAEMQVGDEVLVGGEWQTVEGVDPKTPGYVTLSEAGPVLLDPSKEWDVRSTHGHESRTRRVKGADVKVGDTLHLMTWDESGDEERGVRPFEVLEEPTSTAMGVQVVVKDPDYGRQWRTLGPDEEYDVTVADAKPETNPLLEMANDLMGEKDAGGNVWHSPAIDRATPVLAGMPVGTELELPNAITLRREEHGWIIRDAAGVSAEVDPEAAAGRLKMFLRLRREGRDGGFARIDAAILRRYEDAALEHKRAEQRDLDVANLWATKRDHGGLERLRYDWRARLRLVGLTEADVTEERRAALLEERRLTAAAMKAAQIDVYRDLLQRKDAFEIVDHSNRLASKPFEVRPRPDTVGVLGGEAFLRESGANLSLSRFKTREAAQKAVDTLHARELERVTAGAGGQTPPDGPAGNAVDFDPGAMSVEAVRPDLRDQIGRLREAGDTIRLPGGVRIVAGGAAVRSVQGSGAKRRFRVHGPDGHVDVDAGPQMAALVALQASARSADRESLGGRALGDYREAYLTGDQRATIAREGGLVGWTFTKPAVGRRWHENAVRADGSLEPLDYTERMNLEKSKGLTPDAAIEGSPPEPDRGGLEAPYHYGGRHGLSELQRWPQNDRFELRWRDDGGLVMWDREKNKPHAVWDADFDVNAITRIVNEENVAVSTRQGHAPPVKLTEAQIASLVTGKAPAAAGELAPGFEFTGEAGRASEENGVLKLPAGFFKQTKKVREGVVYRHLGRQLYGDLSDDDVARAGELGVRIPEVYASLNSDALRDRIEALEPEKAEFVARLAEKAGLPLSPKAREWLAGRGVELGDRAAAVGAPDPDPPELVEARALAAEVEKDSGGLRAHFILPERGYRFSHGSPDGKLTTYRNVGTGAEITVDTSAGTSGTATARLNRGAPPMIASTTLGQGTAGLDAVAEIGWQVTHLGDARGMTWRRFVHPDGVAFEAGEKDGTVDEVHGFEPDAAMVDEARKVALRQLPQKFVKPGDAFARGDGDDLRAVLEGGMWKQTTWGTDGESIAWDDWSGVRHTGAVDVEGAEGFARFERYGKVVVVHWKRREDGNGSDVVRAGFGHVNMASGRPPWALIGEDAHNDQADARQRRLDEAKKAGEGDTGPAGADVRPLLTWLKAAEGKKRPGKLPDDAFRALALKPNGDKRNARELAESLLNAGWAIQKAGRGRGKAGATVNYTLRGPDGSTIKVQGGGTYADPGIRKIDVTPNPQGGRRERIKGRLWADKNELYIDALGRADELGERFGATVEVTSIYDGGTGRNAQAHHEWNGTIVMGTGAKFKERFEGYLAKVKAGDTTDRDHVDFYDALSTLQHEINHGVHTDFKTGNYRQDWDVAMEESLTEETARDLTLDWMRAQGMDDALQAIKRMGPTDHRWQGSYQAYRQRLRKLFDEAGIPQEERRALIFRMKFQMSPADRNSFLDEQIAARNPEHRKRLERMPSTEGRIGYSPTKVIMGSGGRNPYGVKRGEVFEPVIDDLLDDVTLAPRPGDVAEQGNRVRFSIHGTVMEGKVQFAAPRDTTGQFADTMDFRGDDGVSYSGSRGSVVAILDGPNAGATKQGAVPGYAAEPIAVGDDVTVRSILEGDDAVSANGRVVEIMSGTTDSIKVEEEDGTALWYSAHRVGLRTGD